MEKWRLAAERFLDARAKYFLNLFSTQADSLRKTSCLLHNYEVHKCVHKNIKMPGSVSFSSNKYVLCHKNVNNSFDRC